MQEQLELPAADVEFTAHARQAVMSDDTEYVLIAQSVHDVLEELVWYFPDVHMTHICDATTGHTHVNRTRTFIPVFKITFIYILCKLVELRKAKPHAGTHQHKDSCPARRCLPRKSNSRNTLHTRQWKCLRSRPHMYLSDTACTTRTLSCSCIDLDRTRRKSRRPVQTHSTCTQRCTCSRRANHCPPATVRWDCTQYRSTWIFVWCRQSTCFPHSSCTPPFKVLNFPEMQKWHGPPSRPE